MKEKILLITIILFTTSFINAQNRFKFPTNFKYPQIKRKASNYKKFIPKNWKVIDKAFGDLNNDKKSDVVLVLKADYAEFLNENDGFGERIFNTNPRMLIILFKEKNGFRLAEKSNSFIAIPNYPTMAEPFVNVSIYKNVIKFDFEHWLSAGGWGAWNNSYKFRLQNGKFTMIGADKYYYQRNTADTELRSYNFLTNKVKTVTGNYSNEEEKEIVKWRKLKLKNRKTFHTFVPFTWEIEYDYHI